MFQPVDRDAGVRAFVALWNAEYPERPETEEAIHSAMRHNASGAPEVHRVAYDGERPIACLFLDLDAPTEPFERLEGDFLIAQDHADELSPQAAEEARSILRTMNLKEVACWFSDRIPARRRAFEEAGFEITQRVPVTELDLDAFDRAPFEEKLREVEGKYRIVSAADLDEEGFDWIPGLWEAAWEMALDMPNPHTPIRPELENYRRRIREEKIFYQTDTMMLALDGEKVVGYSRVTLSPAAPDLAQTGMSGTARDYRRQGIVTALKVEGIDRMKRKGIRRLQTDNDETNPMYQLNLQLGFKPCFQWNRWTITSQG